MFGWKRKSDGFEWHKYVRTTIKLRRNDRRRKIDGLKNAAASKLMDAGHAGAAMGKAGANGAGRILAELPARVAVIARTVLRPIGRFVNLCIGLGMRGVARAGQMAVHGARPLVVALRRPGVAPLVGLVALAVGLSAVGRIYLAGLGFDGVLALALTLCLAIVAVATMVNQSPAEACYHFFDRLRGRFRLPRLSPGRISSATLVGIAGLTIAAAGGWAVWVYGGAFTSMAKLPTLSLPQPFTSNEVIVGRARAISGDRLVIKGRIVRLRGIEAPEPGQTCRSARNRAWRCGAASRRELAEITGRAAIRCEAVRDGGSQSMIGVCRRASADLAELMVQRGGAFAEAGLFSSYGQAEQAAREKKAGIWQGNAERPAAWRAARWARAKDRAPDGCPIKGKVSRRGKFYVLPWSPSYRRARVRSHRGERWFCSEKEAIAAGWRPATAG